MHEGCLWIHEFVNLQRKRSKEERHGRGFTVVERKGLAVNDLNEEVTRPAYDYEMKFLVEPTIKYSAVAAHTLNLNLEKIKNEVGENGFNENYFKKFENPMGDDLLSEIGMEVLGRSVAFDLAYTQNAKRPLIEDIFLLKEKKKKKKKS
eukprot:Trichotokara_eunicae@DN10537_c0_g1_i1.p1